MHGEEEKTEKIREDEKYNNWIKKEKNQQGTGNKIDKRNKKRRIKKRNK